MQKGATWDGTQNEESNQKGKQRKQAKKSKQSRKEAHANNLDSMLNSLSSGGPVASMFVVDVFLVLVGIMVVSMLPSFFSAHEV